MLLNMPQCPGQPRDDELSGAKWTQGERYLHKCMHMVTTEAQDRHVARTVQLSPEMRDRQDRWRQHLGKGVEV